MRGVGKWGEATLRVGIEIEIEIEARLRRTGMRGQG